MKFLYFFSTKFLMIKNKWKIKLLILYYFTKWQQNYLEKYVKKNRITHLINERILYNGRFQTNKFILAIRVPFLKNFLRHQDAWDNNSIVNDGKRWHSLAICYFILGQKDTKRFTRNKFLSKLNNCINVVRLKNDCK